MNLQKFILFRKKLQNIESTAFGFSGLLIVENELDTELISEFRDSEIRELYYQNNDETANQDNLKVGDEVIILIDLSKFTNYYESFKEFIASNKYNLRHEEFYIFDIDYFHTVSVSNKNVNNFLQLQEIISFLKSLSNYEKKIKGLLELFFHKPDKICSIIINYTEDDIENLHITKSVSELQEHVFEKSDQETRKKLFTNEMINLLSIDGYDFKNLLKNWNAINNSYRSSFQIYLSEFSFQKIKNSSQEYFHDLTDRIYSTISKFSTYILAIPIAYIFILRFFDFDGENFPKDTFLLMIGISYFMIIWFVLLNNLSKAFNSIENDIISFQQRISNESDLEEITRKLDEQKVTIIPSQKNKIRLVKILSVFVLVLIMVAYLYIHWELIIEKMI